MERSDALSRTIRCTPGCRGVSYRVSVVGQSFLIRGLSEEGLYLLESVVCDWPDREATVLLRRCPHPPRPNGRVVIVNGDGPGDRAYPSLLMMVLVGGKYRT